MFASSSDPDHRLGPMLLRRGAITLRQMEDAVRNQTPGKRFGTVLVESGVLDPKQLVRGVVDQTREIILNAFRWTSGSYRLTEGKGPGEDITLNISTPQLVLDGISQIESWTRVERGCGGLDGPLHAGSRGRRACCSASSRWTSTRPCCCARSRASATLEALCAESALNHFEVCRNLWAFRVIGLLRRAEPARAAARRRRPRVHHAERVQLELAPAREPVSEPPDRQRSAKLAAP